MEKLVLYGCGAQGIKTLEKLNRCDGMKDVDFFCDSSPEKEGGYICGIKIISPQTLFELSCKYAVSVIVCSMYYKEIIESMRARGIIENSGDIYVSEGEEADIVPVGSLYQPLSPLFDLRNVGLRPFNRMNISGVKFEPVETDGMRIKIDIDAFGDKRLRMLEHVYDRAKGASTSTVIAVKNGNRLYASNDMCETFEEREINIVPSERIIRCFTETGGNHIIMMSEKGEAADKKRFIITDSDFNELHTTELSREIHPWHGTFSIDQSTSGTIMYAEYPEGVYYKEASVYRSANGGVGWKRVFTLSASQDMSRGEIRHFHTCMADPFIEGRWYVTAGDKGSSCQTLFISEDDGVTWERHRHGEVCFRSLGLSDDDKAGITDQLYRMTAAIIKEDSIYYINDSTYHDGIYKSGEEMRTTCVPCFTRAYKHAPYNADVLSKVGVSAVRSIVSVTEDIFIAFTENKSLQDKIDIFIVSLKSGEIRYVGGVPARRQGGGTYSVSSRAACRGRFVVNLHDTLLGDGGVLAVVRCDLRRALKREGSANSKQ